MELENVKTFIVGLILVSLIAAVGTIAIDNFKSDIQDDSYTTVANETVTLTALAGSLSQGPLFVTLNHCYNASGATAALVINRDCNVTAGSVKVGNASLESVKIGYTHYTPSSARNITMDGLVGTKNTTSYFGTAGTIMGVALILTIVVGAFYFIKGEGK